MQKLSKVEFEFHHSHAILLFFFILHALVLALGRLSIFSEVYVGNRGRYQRTVSNSETDRLADLGLYENKYS